MGYCWPLHGTKNQKLPLTAPPLPHCPINKPGLHEACTSESSHTSSAWDQASLLPWRRQELPHSARPYAVVSVTLQIFNLASYYDYLYIDALIQLRTGTQFGHWGEPNQKRGKINASKKQVVAVQTLRDCGSCSYPPCSWRASVSAMRPPIQLPQIYIYLYTSRDISYRCNYVQRNGCCSCSDCPHLAHG